MDPFIQLNNSYIFVFKDFLLWLPFDPWSFNVISLNSQLWALHGHGVQALQNQNVTQAVWLTNVSLPEISMDL